jgi:hypothetical protein
MADLGLPKRDPQHWPVRADVEASGRVFMNVVSVGRLEVGSKKLLAVFLLVHARFLASSRPVRSFVRVAWKLQPFEQKRERIAEAALPRPSRRVAMAEQHFSGHVPNTVAPICMKSDSNSTLLFLGVIGSAGYLSLLAFEVLRIAGT